MAPPKKQKTTAADWENLPHDLLIAVSTKLTNLSTNIRFTGVCRSWRLAGSLDRRRLIERQIPGIILPPSSNSHSGGTREFIPVTDIINHQKKKRKPNLVPWRLEEWSLCIAGSLRGWILALDCDLKMALLNPATGSQIVIPEDHDTVQAIRIRPNEFSSWGFWYNRTTIWAPPDGDDHSAPVSDWFVFVLMPGEARLKTYIKYCRVGDGAGWRVMKFPACRFGSCYIVDVLCSSTEAGYLYVLMSTGELFRCSFSKKMETTVVVEMASESSSHQVIGAYNYLVEVEGEILVLHRNRESQGRCRTRGFDAYKLDREGKRWVEVREFGAGGDCAVFFGFGQAFTVRAYSELGIKGNCVYVLELGGYGGEERRISVYDLKASTISFFPVRCAFERPCAGMPVQVPIPIAPVPW